MCIWFLSSNMVSSPPPYIPSHGMFSSLHKGYCIRLTISSLRIRFNESLPLTAQSAWNTARGFRPVQRRLTLSINRSTPWNSFCSSRFMSQSLLPSGHAAVRVRLPFESFKAPPRTMYLLLYSSCISAGISSASTANAAISEGCIRFPAPRASPSDSSTPVYDRARVPDSKTSV